MNRPKSIDAKPSHASTSSTKRDPSLFEHVQANDEKAEGRKQRKRTCTVCKQTGHNARFHRNKKSSPVRKHPRAKGADFGSKTTETDVEVTGSRKNDASQKKIGLHCKWITDMTPDGHCGFRAVAFHQMGNKNQWNAVEATWSPETPG